MDGMAMKLPILIATGAAALFPATALADGQPPPGFLAVGGQVHDASDDYDCSPVRPGDLTLLRCTAWVPYHGYSGASFVVCVWTQPDCVARPRFGEPDGQAVYGLPHP